MIRSVLFFLFGHRQVAESMYPLIGKLRACSCEGLRGHPLFRIEKNLDLQFYELENLHGRRGRAVCLESGQSRRTRGEAKEREGNYGKGGGPREIDPADRDEEEGGDPFAELPCATSRL